MKHTKGKAMNRTKGKVNNHRYQDDLYLSIAEWKGSSFFLWDGSGCGEARSRIENLGFHNAQTAIGTEEGFGFGLGSGPGPSKRSSLCRYCGCL